MQKEDIKSGFLQVPPSWLQHLLNKPWVKKQCFLYPASRQGVKRLEVFDLTPSLRRKEPAGLIIPLTDCLKISEDHWKGKDFVFSVVTRNGSYVFAAASINELKEWVDALQRITFGETRDSDCRKLLGISKSLGEQCDDNVLYGSITESRTMFSVTVEENETTLRLNLAGPHLVQVTATSVQLRTVADGRLRASWLFSHIRRYGQTRGSFVMEVGRSSETGQGSFLFRTREAGELQTVLQHVMAEYEANRHSAAPDVPTTPPPQPPPQPPPPPPPEPYETQTLGRLGSGRKTKTKITIAKPPRRTKAAAATKAAATAEDLPNVVPLAEKQWLLTQSLKMASLDDEPTYSNEKLLGALSAPFVSEPDELMYSEPEERHAAWRELGRSVEHVEHVAHVDIRRSALSDTWDETAAAALAEPLRPTPAASSGRASVSYARLQHMPRSTEPSGAQYARLGVGLGAGGSEERTAAWAADQSRRQETASTTDSSAVGAADTEAMGTVAGETDDQPLYANLPGSSLECQSIPGSEGDAGSHQPAVTHVVVNDTKYALLDKSTKSGLS